MKYFSFPLIIAIFVILIQLPFSFLYFQKSDIYQNDLVDITSKLKQRLQNEDVGAAVETIVPGVFQTKFGNQYGYLVDGGSYVIIGEMIDLADGRNLTEDDRRKIAATDLANYSDDKLIVFPADNEELAVLNVFTDTSCPYCKLLHEEVGFLQQAGISVRYFPFPRGGKGGPGYTELQKVWCATDKIMAMNIAKGTAVGSLTTADCERAQYVDEGYAIGQRVGITGTPALFTADGRKFDGYVPYQRLIPLVLEQL